MPLQALVRFYHELSEESVARFAEFYAEDVHFKDPFNDVRGLAAVQRIFRHMFRQVAVPRFVVVEQIVDTGGAMLAWEFYYRVRLWGQGGTQVIRGVSHLRFNAAGKVIFHRDYWDTAEELYMKVPALGLVLRGLRRALSAG